MTFVEALITRTLMKFAEDPQAIGRFLDHLNSPMPNIKARTMGGEFFWNTIAEFDGWRMQENQVFGNCRIIDPDNVRKAWGGKNAILNAFEKIDYV